MCPGRMAGPEARPLRPDRLGPGLGESVVPLARTRGRGFEVSGPLSSAGLVCGAGRCGLQNAHSFSPSCTVTLKTWRQTGSPPWLIASETYSLHGSMALVARRTRCTQRDAFGRPQGSGQPFQMACSPGNPAESGSGPYPQDLERPRPYEQNGQKTRTSGPFASPMALRRMVP